MDRDAHRFYPGGRFRPGRLGASLLLLIPLLAVTTAAGEGSAEPRPQAAEAAATRIAYAGTRHRSLGQVKTDTHSAPLFGEGPAHFDLQPSALGDQMVFASRRDEKAPQVYLRTADGSVRKLTSGRYAGHPQLTPDGSSVVFDSAEPGARTAASSATCGWCAPTAPASPGSPTPPGTRSARRSPRTGSAWRTPAATSLR